MKKTRFCYLAASTSEFHLFCRKIIFRNPLLASIWIGYQKEIGRRLLFPLPSAYSDTGCARLSLGIEPRWRRNAVYLLLALLVVVCIFFLLVSPNIQFDGMKEEEEEGKN